MRKFLGTLAMVGLLIAVLGLFRGWFDVATHDDPSEINVEVTIDKDKIREDTKHAAEKAKEFSADIERRMDQRSERDE
jgi:DNA polymerase III delta prime subunit